MPSLFKVMRFRCIFILVIFLCLSSLACGKQKKWYVNEDFKFRIRKLRGWDFKEDKDEIEGIAMLNLVFSEESRDKEFQNLLIINVSKKLKPDNYLRGRLFIAFADAAIESTAESLNKVNFIKHPETILINDAPVREAVFEWEEPEYNFKKVTARLMHFHPIETENDLIMIFVIFKCKSRDYSRLSSALESSLMSIEAGQISTTKN